jgi:WD40 repeat protein
MGKRPTTSEATMSADRRGIRPWFWPTCLLVFAWASGLGRADDLPRPGEPLRLEHKAEVFSLVFAPDGQTLASAGHGDVHLWDPATGKLRRRLTGYKGTVYALAFAPGGKALAVGHYKDYQTYEGVISLLDPATGRELRRFGGHREAVRRLAFTPDGKTLFSVGTDKTLRAWDTASGNELRRFTALAASTDPVAFSPDGRVLATNTFVRPDIAGNGHDKIDSIRLWDTASGKELARFQKGFLQVHTFAFAPDRGLLALAGFNDQLFLWETATGKELRRCDNGRINRCIQGGCVVFSPEGRTLATAEIASGLCLWEVATGRLRRDLTQPGDARALTFSADGRLLAAGGTDGLVRVWHVFGPARPKGQEAANLPPQELDALWGALADGDAAKAYRALVALAAAPGQAVPLLRRHLRPVRAVEAGVLQKLIADLESEQFAVREKAGRELEELDRAAADALRRALDKKLSLEGRQRIRELLKRLDDEVLSGRRLRAVRAVEVLEHCGTAEARKLLQALADGAPEALLTREARAALQRLKGRPVPASGAP